MSSTLITNTSIEPCALPFPFAGVLQGGKSAKLNVAIATVIAAFGGSDALGGFKVAEVSDGAPYDTEFMGSLSSSLGVVALPGALETRGSVTATGGIVGGGALAKLSNIPIGPVARASIGTDAAHVAGTLYISEIGVPATRLVTGIGILNGTVVGTDNLIVALYDEDGAVLGTSALAGTLSAGADDFQEIALTAPVTIPGPGRYFVALQCNGTTAATQKIAAATYLNAAKSQAGVFGTIPATITPPTTTAAGTGPVAYLY